MKDIDLFENGSILKLKLTSFMTYEQTEFVFCPNMNMVIGPNGSGKSAVVCAITLCLGGTTGIIGRGKEINSFIKHNHEKAIIEVTLKSNRSPRKRVKIERTVFKAKGSEYKIDGIKKTAADVSKIVKEHNIHLDNLCQVLPQDKVSDFARLSPQETLIETQKAVFPESLKKHHELISLHIELKNIEKKKQTLENDSSLLKKEIECSQGQILRIKEYQRTIKRLEGLKAKKPFIEYQEVENKFAQLKKEKEILKEKIEQLQAPFQGIREKIKEEKKREENEINLIERGRSNLKQNEKKIRALLNRLEAEQSHTDEIRNETLKLREKKKNVKEDIKKLTYEAAVIEKQIANPPDKRIDFYDEIFTAHTVEMEELNEKTASLDSEAWNKEEIGKNALEKHNELKKELLMMNDTKDKKIEILKKINLNTYKAYNWLCSNQGLFKKRVYGPACLELTVKNKAYACVMEALLSKTNLLAFFCLCEEDYDLFLRHTTDENKWIVNVIFLVDSKNINTPDRVTREEMTKIGFECFADEQLIGPKEVISAISEYSKIHCVPLSKEGNIRLIETAEKHAKIKRFCIGTVLYDIKRNKTVGINATRTIKSNKCRFFDLKEDKERQKEIQLQIEEIKQTKENNQKTYMETLNKKSVLIAEINKKKEEFKPIEESRTNLHNAYKEHTKKRRRLAIITENINRQQEELKQMKNEDETKSRFIQAVKNRAGMCVDLKEMLREIYTKVSETKIKEIQMIRTNIEIEEMTNKLKEKELSFETEQKEYSRLKEEYGKTKKRKHEAKLKTESTSIDTEVKRMFSVLPETLRELEVEIEREEIKKTGLNEKDLSALDRYETKKKKIESIEETKKKVQVEIDRKVKEITKKREEWEKPLEIALEKLSSRFTKLFEAIGFVGCIFLKKNQSDFDWKIEIQVKFRNTESLKPLSLHRQSGGERSVTTIAYLLALHDMFRLPFRIVDEINQGMDSTNERKVHDILASSSEKEGSQFILITPKLLTGLTYTDKIKVLCIYKGRHFLSSGQRQKKQKKIDSFLKR